MKAWDTNLLVRHLVEDDDAQLRLVRRELQRAEQRGATIWIADVTLVETFWVLQHGYGLKESAVIHVLDRLLDDSRFVFESRSDARLALERTAIRGDLPEHLISLAARRAGAEKTQTFDRAVKEFADFEVLSTEKIVGESNQGGQRV